MRLGFGTFLAALALIFALAPASAAPKFPALSGRVVDDAHVLSPATVADLTAKLAALEAKTSRQLVVVTVPSLQGYDIADFGYQLGRAWGIGQAKLNNGALFIVAPTEHKVRIEVGYGLEPILTDALSEVILQSDVLPKFRSDDFNGGIEAGVDAVIAQLSLDPSAAEAKVAAAEQQAGSTDNRGGISPIFVLLAVWFVFALIRHAATGKGTGFGLWPLLFLAGSPRQGGNWGGGGFGGGFGGGGGSFGGGGASGSW